ncbi:MAG TPA: VOC family protein [Rhizomicrobium sp.]|jgi:methylmalonyl-CoA/ethylmalonyl-CoA epimerase|nr:VOC family protein [Rhizomicrobium sp.]
MENPGNKTLDGRKLVQVALTVRDLDRSRHFYRDILGLRFVFEAGNMMFFDLGGTRLLIGTENAGGEPGGSILYFDAPDIDALGPALESRGVTFLGPAQVVQQTETHALKIRAFRDPDGNVLQLMGNVAR